MAIRNLIGIKTQIEMLKEIALDYPGKTIENIILQMESREKEGK